MKVVLCLLLLTIFTSSTANASDPGQHSGQALDSMTIGEFQWYDSWLNYGGYPVELRGSVHYPAGLPNSSYPLVLILHGFHYTCYDTSTNTPVYSWPCISGEEQIPNYRGYDYLAKSLASHGYIVASISANGLNAKDVAKGGQPSIADRANLIQYHLNLWTSFNTRNISVFYNKVDMSKIGLVGHSMGGQAVVNYLNNYSDYDIDATLLIAPGNSNYEDVTGTNLSVMLPYCDDDSVWGLGANYYDEERYNTSNDTSSRFSLVHKGANHHYYNWVWTDEFGAYPGQPIIFPGSGDDWTLNLFGLKPNLDGFCNADVSGNGRISAPQQRANSKSYINAFMRTHLGGETGFEDILTGEAPLPAYSGTISESHAGFFPKAQNRLVINSFTGSINTNDLGGAVQTSGLLDYRHCGEGTADKCDPTVDIFKQPNLKGKDKLTIKWNIGATYKNTIPTAYKNMSVFDGITFRAGTQIRSQTGVDVDFRIRFSDNNGNQATIKISDISDTLLYPPGNQNSFTQTIYLSSIYIPFSDIPSINVANIKDIEFLFDQMDDGAVVLADLMAVKM